MLFKLLYYLRYITMRSLLTSLITSKNVNDTHLYMNTNNKSEKSFLVYYHMLVNSFKSIVPQYQGCVTILRNTWNQLQNVTNIDIMGAQEQAVS